MISIHIIRDRLTTNTDDVIEIFKSSSEDNLFSVSYIDRDSRLRYSFDAYPDQIARYLYSVFGMLRIDEEPFESVQITLPAHPPINVKIASLSASRIEAFMQPLKWCLRNWMRSTAASFAQRHERV